MSSFSGPLFRPGDGGYDTERAGFNLTVEHRPELIVGATGPDDVIAAVEYASARGLAVAVLTTGHGPAVPADGQVLINTRRTAIPSAVGGRDAAYVLFAASILPPGQDDAVRAAHRQLRESMRPWATSATIYNFPSGSSWRSPPPTTLASPR